VLPAAIGPTSGGAAAGIAQVFTGACSGGKRPYRDMMTTDYFDPSHGWFGNQPAWVLDLGPTSGAPGNAFVRQRPETVPPDSGDDDDGGDDGSSCTPYPQPCTSSSQCCPGTTCMNTVMSSNQCCACLQVGNFCQSPAACAAAQARGEDVIWPGDPRFDASMAE
jgi:hypothetical protein